MSVDPAEDTWAKIQKEMNEPLQVSKSDTTEKRRLEPSARRSSRGIGLSQEEPEPSLIMLTASTTRNMLVAVVDLIHKSLTSASDSDAEGR